MKKQFFCLAIFSFVFLTSSFGQNWLLTGNSGTNPPTNFLGTKDNKALVFKTNNTERVRIGTNGFVGIGENNPVRRLDVKGDINIGKGSSLYVENHRVLRVDSASGNIFLGNGSGVKSSSNSNTATGYYALSSSNSEGYNTAYGYGTLFSNSSGYYNTAAGVDALYFNTTGVSNIANGSFSLYKNSTGSYNSAYGVNALTANTTGGFNIAIGAYALPSNTTGSYNIATGTYALDNNTTGDYNTAIGNSTLFSNTTGVSNIAIGTNALYNNTTGNYNTANGHSALLRNTTGITNTATGVNALYFNTTGSYNTANGNESLFFNTTGSHNTAYGNFSLRGTTSSQYNTAIGDGAGSGFDNGYNNVFVGANTDVNGADYFNVIAIGQGTVCTASSQVTMGNSATNSYRAYANWSNISDGRYKKNLRDDVPGLKFINKLKPVTYTLDATGINKFLHNDIPANKQVSAAFVAAQERALKEKEQIRHTGFVAQEVEKAAKELNYDFSGVDAAKNEKDLYALRYAEFVVPLVKAVQELSQQNDELKSEIRNLKSEMEASLPVRGQGNAIKNYKLSDLSTASLEQNTPNPFTQTTTINYTLPRQYKAAKIIITDKSAKAIREINVSGIGRNTLTVDASTLSSGTYQYSLYADGELIGTKQMVLVK